MSDIIADGLPDAIDWLDGHTLVRFGAVVFGQAEPLPDSVTLPPAPYPWALTTPAREILQRARLHLLNRLTALRQGTRITSEQQMRAFVAHCAGELSAASDELLKAAEALKSAGKGQSANRAYLAHKRARQGVEGMR